MVPAKYKAVAISTNTTTVIIPRPGCLHSVVITGGVAGTIDIYDNASAASGTKLASFSSTNTPGSFLFDCEAALGITVVTSAATLLTVNYR